MATNINRQDLMQFITRTAHTNKLTEKTAQKLGIDEDKFEEANDNGNTYLELNEIVEDKDLYEQFATMYIEEQEKKTDAKDKEKEKEKQTLVKDKNGAGV